LPNGSKILVDNVTEESYYNITIPEPDYNTGI